MLNLSVSHYSIVSSKLASKSEFEIICSQLSVQSVHFISSVQSPMLHMHDQNQRERKVKKAKVNEVITKGKVSFVGFNF